MSRTIKIIHAADFHLDSPFEALGEEKAALRRGEQREILQRVAAIVKAEKADLVLLAGDLLDSRFAYAETARALGEALDSIACSVFISPGNHDFFSADSPYARLELPDNVHIFTKNRMTEKVLPELDVRIWGAAYTDAVCPPLLGGFMTIKEPGVLDIGILHGEVGNPGSRYCPISEEDIEESGLDYLALGHVHTFGGLQRAGNTFYAYPGCPEGRGFDECGEKGVLSVELSQGGAEVKFIPTSSRKYALVQANADGELPERMSAGKSDIVRIELTGECEKAPDIQKIFDRYKDSFFALQVRDKTRPRQDLWERVQEDSLRGLLLRKMKERYELSRGEEEREKIIAAVRWGIAALDGGEAVDSL